MPDLLKSPFPYFGGKAAVASLVWERLGQVDNFIEPFAGSLAVLLRRPRLGGVETVNDLDCYIPNFWRSIQRDPEAVVTHCNYPVIEADLHARHRWLVFSDDAIAFRQRIRTDPDYFDPKIAGWWVWGICCWIGGNWCQYHGNPPKRRPIIAGDNPGSYGKGAHAAGQSQQRPFISGNKQYGMGIHAAGRPQLADAYDVGRGVHSHGDLGTCAQRRAWLLEWLGRLSDRLRNVRVCCGDWSRVCSSESVTTRLGITGVFLDPPYPRRRKDGTKSRACGLYGTDKGSDKSPEEVRDEILVWAQTHGGNRLMRICIAGYEGDGYESLGWAEVPWKAGGGYGNRTAEGKANARRERLWFSPHCCNQRTLFDDIESTRNFA